MSISNVWGDGVQDQSYSWCSPWCCFFSICWCPAIFLVFVIVLEDFSKLSVISQCIDLLSLYYIMIDFLPAVNSCFSPFIYIIFLSDFRKATKRVLCRCKPTVNQQVPREEIELQHLHHVEHWQIYKEVHNFVINLNLSLASNAGFSFLQAFCGFGLPVVREEGEWREHLLSFHSHSRTQTVWSSGRAKIIGSGKGYIYS